MTTEYGIPIPIPSLHDGLGEQGLALSTSHKRGSYSQTPLYVPEAKRQQLASGLGAAGADRLPRVERNLFGNYHAAMLRAAPLNEAPPPPPPPPEEPVGSQDEDASLLLSNLPTSVDDLALKELHLKLERHASSPQMVLLSRQHSPLLEEPAANGRSSASSEHRLTVSGCGLHSSCNSSSGQLDLDADDLEVAMINESFEQEQKQSMILECNDLKSLFYGAPAAAADGAAPRPIVTESLVDGDSEADEPDGAGLLGSPGGGGFIPVLTPKSKGFVLGKRAQYDVYTDLYGGGGQPASCRPLKMAELTRREPSPPACDGLSRQRHSPSKADESDEERDRQLDLELEKMMLDGEEECRQDDEDVFGQQLEDGGLAWPAPPAHAQRTLAASRWNASDECADAAAAVAYGVVASLFCSPVGHERAGEEEASPLEERLLLSESLLRDIEAEEDFLPSGGEEDGGALLAAAAASGSTPSLYHLHSGGEGSSPSASTAGSGQHMAASTSSADEQKVPVVLDSWEDVPDEESGRKLLRTVERRGEEDPLPRDTQRGGGSAAEELPAHVLEASATAAGQGESDVRQQLRLMGLDEGAVDVRRVDARRWLLVFPSAVRASTALLSPRRAGRWLRLCRLEEAQELSRLRAVEWAPAPKPRCVRRPPAAVAVARRIVEDSLDMRAPQRELGEGKGQKRIGKALWEGAAD